LSLTVTVFVFAAGTLQCEEGPSKGSVDVTFADLAQDPQKFDGRLVRVRALLALSWEGDNFLSEPTPESLPPNAPSYIWFYWKPERERQVYEPIRHARRGSVYGSFTGYFHFVPKPQIVNGAFAPGPLQF
jgi:hypothetical protein